MHPDGDEMLFLLSGSIDVVLDHGQEEEVITLTEGRMCIVPRNVWHRQLVRETGDLLFATPGPSTEHRGVRAHKALRDSSADD
jgi:mannose-6-phosphate isomerase-like protein (cupin superfamily)